MNYHDGNIERRKPLLSVAADCVVHPLLNESYRFLEAKVTSICGLDPHHPREGKRGRNREEAKFHLTLSLSRRLNAPSSQTAVSSGAEWGEELSGVSISYPVNPPGG